MLRIAILNCDFIKKEFAVTYGQYPEMFRHIIKESGLTFTYESFNILDFDYPTTLNDFDLYLITGSKASVYDDEEWILNLFEFVRSLDNVKKNILGFCFGHQVIAQALGGQVQKHPQGWHVGAKELITSAPALIKSSVFFFVMPNPLLAAFSPLAITKSIFFSVIILGRFFFIASTPGIPNISPKIKMFIAS